MQNKKFEKEPSEFKERLVAINRVAKVVKGGKNFRFTALMVVGNEMVKLVLASAKPWKFLKQSVRVLRMQNAT